MMHKIALLVLSHPTGLPKSVQSLDLPSSLCVRVAGGVVQSLLQMLGHKTCLRGYVRPLSSTGTLHTGTHTIILQTHADGVNTRAADSPTLHSTFAGTRTCGHLQASNVCASCLCSQGRALCAYYEQSAANP